MAHISYHDRRFRSVSNSGSGEVDANTLFDYRQEGDLLWATYAGGAIRFGTLTGLVKPDGTLNFCYTHVNQNGDIMTGCCNSTPELLSDERLRLHESWQWTNGDRSSGQSIVEEVAYV